MPVTPLHVGPGAILKALAPGYFSFTAFGFTQVIIDLEPLYYISRGEWPIHRFFHTYLGSTAVAVVVVLVGRPICEMLLRIWNRRLDPGQKRWLYVEPKISVLAAATGAISAAYSHVLLDSVMHSDLRPFAPLSDANGLLYIISVDQLHVVCLGLGVVGGIMLLFVWLHTRRRIDTATRSNKPKEPMR